MDQPAGNAALSVPVESGSACCAGFCASAVAADSSAKNSTVLVVGIGILSEMGPKPAAAPACNGAGEGGGSEAKCREPCETDLSAISASAASGPPWSSKSPSSDFSAASAMPSFMTAASWLATSSRAAAILSGILASTCACEACWATTTSSRAFSRSLSRRCLTASCSAFSATSFCVSAASCCSNDN